jgi:hypothetical protein
VVIIARLKRMRRRRGHLKAPGVFFLSPRGKSGERSEERGINNEPLLLPPMEEREKHRLLDSFEKV